MTSTRIAKAAAVLTVSPGAVLLRGSCPPPGHARPTSRRRRTAALPADNHPFAWPSLQRSVPIPAADRAVPDV
ncbi:hypothetical protein [Kitasatospora griseola]|uniref:hypothetical protein n=1 Tax=Kitasatospora griseola TaxID=2064 RepID=UPI003801DF1D